MFFGGNAGRVTINEPISQTTLEKKLSDVFLKEIGLEDETDPSSDIVYGGFEKLANGNLAINIAPLNGNGNVMQFNVSREYTNDTCETHLTTITGDNDIEGQLNTLRLIVDTLGGEYNFKEQAFDSQPTHHSSRNHKPVSYDTENEIHLLALEASDKVQSELNKALQFSGVVDSTYSDVITNEVYNKTKNTITMSVEAKNERENTRNNKM